MKLIIGILAMLLPVLSPGQAPNTRPLTIGDTMPGITARNVINYTTTSFSTATFKKPLLLDFFGSHCSGCIAALPYFNTLQDSLAGSLQVLVVCTEPAAVIQHLLQTNPLLKGIRLPFITSDTVLYGLFPHQSIPHEVWIGQNGTVQAITIADYVNKVNLQKLVSGRPLRLPVKTDAQKFDPALPLAANASAGESTVLFSTTITGFVNNASPGITGTALSEDGRYRRTYFINLAPLNLCMAALGYLFTANRFILETGDSSRLLNTGKKQYDWFLTHALGYEITVPAGTPSPEAERHILNDIAGVTGTRIHISKRRMPCYVLVTDTGSAAKDPRSRDGKPAAVFISENGAPAYLRNQPVSGLVKAMNAGSFDAPQSIVIDESGYTSPVDMDLGPVDIHDITAMQHALQPYGFRLVKTTRLLEMVIVAGIHHQNK